MALTYSSQNTLDYLLKDLDMLESAHRRWLAGEYDHLVFRCYNQTEADMYRQYVDQRYPHFPVVFTWLDFTTGEVTQEENSL